ncbi:MAG: class I SAM-dependent methyltransferase [Treponema sp.]|nr:class I SAM-dependent methyltransferase [Treponema sp.]
MTNTLSYYAINAQDFINSTISVDMKSIQNEFLSLLKRDSLILDYGCGSGRDSKYFLEKGFKVEAFDGCDSFCKAASKLAGIVVKNITFSDFSEKQKYDGIWACSSLLHAQKSELPYLLKKIEEALKLNGIFYCSFKKGKFEGERNGRYFSDFTKEELTKLVETSTNLSLVKIWMTKDARPERNDEWINSIWRKR